MERTPPGSAGADGTTPKFTKPSTRRVHSGSPAPAQPAGEPIFPDADALKARIAALERARGDIEAMRLLLVGETRADEN